MPHQGCFYKNTAELIYDTNFKVFADFCLNQKMFKNNLVIEVLEAPIVAFHDMGGISHDKNTAKKFLKLLEKFWFTLSNTVVDLF